MLLTNDYAKINIPFNWTIDFENCNNNYIVFKNIFDNKTILEIGGWCKRGYIQCIVFKDREGRCLDYMYLYTNEILNKNYNIVVSDLEVMNIVNQYEYVKDKIA